MPSMSGYWARIAEVASRYASRLHAVPCLLTSSMLSGSVSSRQSVWIWSVGLPGAPRIWAIWPPSGSSSPNFSPQALATAQMSLPLYVR